MQIAFGRVRRKTSPTSVGVFAELLFIEMSTYFRFLL